jgi:N-acetylmuramoyl-L-alanine amidase
MRSRGFWLRGVGSLACLLIGAFGLAMPAQAQAQAKGGSALQSSFAAAAHEFGVPESVLLAVSYNESQWESHQGHPSTSGAWGVMALTDVPATALGGRGGDAPNSFIPSTNDPSLHTLSLAAQLIGVPADTLKTDQAANVRGGAALLVRYEKQALGTAPGDVASWYAAAARYNGAADVTTAKTFADDVFKTINQGASRTTSDGQQVSVRAQKVQANTSTLSKLGLKNLANQPCPDVPAQLGVKCEYVPAAYQIDDPKDDTNYGNYDIANRPLAGQENGMPDVRYVVMHDNETTYDHTLKIFQNPLDYASANFEVRSSDGQVAQLVRTKDVAWHAGNWYVNMHAIGIEQEGWAMQGATWFTEPLYHASARLVRYFSRLYGIPLDRMHILGHDNVPGNSVGAQKSMHWDPGPYWSWDHFMDLLGAPIPRLPNVPGFTKVVAITPNFEKNQPPLACDPKDEDFCNPPYLQPAQPASVVYLHAMPSESAPLVTNPNIPATWDPLWAHDWANKASTGEVFVAAGRQGDWQGVYFSGQVAWFYDPRNARTASGSYGHMIVTPKQGLASIPVYGRAYPELSAYPADRPDIVPASIISFDSIPAGQSYVAWGPVQTDYYWANHYTTQLQGSDHIDVIGKTKYYEISFNHRVAFVQADDVTLSWG